MKRTKDKASKIMIHTFTAWSLVIHQTLRKEWRLQMFENKALRRKNLLSGRNRRFGRVARRENFTICALHHTLLRQTQVLCDEREG